MTQNPLINEQVTLGITALFLFKVHIDKEAYDLDVGLRYPSGAKATNGSFVQRIISYMIWVQTGAIQVSFYL